jgi:tetratricopeptide (TPR) repeat protein
VPPARDHNGVSVMRALGQCLGAKCGRTAWILLLCAGAVTCVAPAAAANSISRSDVVSYFAAFSEPLFTVQSRRVPESSSDGVLASAQSLEEALSRGQQEKVHELLLQLLDRPHLDSDFLLRLGIRLAGREMYPEAARVFERCVQEHPTIFEAYYNLALSYVAQQKWTEAVAALERAPQRSHSETVACSYLRGKIEDSEGETSKAEHDLSAAFDGAPQNETYGLELGLFYIRHHLYPQATAVLERTESSNQHSSFLLLELSLARFLAGQESQSVEELKKLLAMRPGFAPAELLMTFELMMGGKLADAERTASIALHYPHPSPYLYYLHASVLVKLQSRQYSRILKELHIARDGIPSCSLCYLTESKAHQAQGNFVAAISDLETAVGLDPDFPDAWYRLASLYRRVGRRADAIRALDHFQKLKVDKEERESQILREHFLKTMDMATPMP